tara:strand:+ start:183 stop:371 length:189 start_codon:yes stop_codon:yes gene_type:complete
MKFILAAVVLAVVAFLIYKAITSKKSVQKTSDKKDDTPTGDPNYTPTKPQPSKDVDENGNNK